MARQDGVAASQRLARGSLTWWALPTTAFVLWIAAVAWPMIAGLASITNQPPQPIEHQPIFKLLLTTLGWSLAVAIGAAAVGWLPGRVLGRSLRTPRFVSLMALVLAPICLPAYIVFYAWWQSWPPDSALFQWLVRHEAIDLARQATLYASLVCWSWPLAALCVAGAAAATPASQEDLLALDGPSLIARLRVHFRNDAPGLATGAIIVFLATLNNTTSFDLAGVFTMANELRAIEAMGAPAAPIMRLALPMIVMSLLGIGVAWWLLRRMLRLQPSTQMGAISRASLIGAGTVWCVTVVLPLSLFIWSAARDVGSAGMREFSVLYLQAMFRTAGLAMVSGVLAAAACAGLALLWLDGRRRCALLAAAITFSWALAGIVPGTIMAAGLEAAYNRAGVSTVVYETAGILILAHLAAFGLVGALLGRLAAAVEPRSVRDLRMLDGPRSLGAVLAATWPALLASCVAAMLITAVLAVSEVVITAQVNPPRSIDEIPLAVTLLNDLHYQRPGPVMLSAVAMMVMALIAALAVAALWGWLSWRWSLRALRAGAGVAMVVFVLGLAGCDSAIPDEPTPMRTVARFGSPGQAMGQFAYPRAIAADAAREVVYVIDKLARVQRFGFDGEPQLQWSMPEMDNGKPTGVTVGLDGTVYVADTHYFRVIAYDADGNERFRFGEYGRGPGQFIYTTDIAIGPKGRLYVSEYGGNDRVQVFDAMGNYLFEFGSFGSEPGQFRRPQALAFNGDKSELYIADACNHRIVVTDSEGNVLRSFGTVGNGPGQFAYPYSVEVLDDRSLMVAEFRNNRIQRLDAHGRCLGLYGRLGRDEGELQYPWAIAAADDRVFVLDSGNNRVQVMRAPG